MESYPLPHASSTVHLALFTPLSPSTAASLRQYIITASQLPADEAGDAERRKVEFAFVEAGMVTSRLHALTAVNQALLAHADRALKTKTLHSEVLYFFEPGLNITDSLKHFGLSPSTRSLLLIHIAPSSPSSSSTPPEEAADVLRRMEDLVEGSTLESLDLLGRLPEGGTDERGLRKTYKLNQDAAFSTLKAGTPEHLAELDRLATSAVALKAAA
ncbi:hypothetical protein JCM6882_005020 [Rhodosporidiobolus microsporus]